MTHEELFTKIKTGNEVFGIKYAPDSHTFALRRVVELHKPYTYTNYLKQELQFCSVCEVGNPPDSHPYPCPTIQAIEKELGNGLG